MKKFLFICLLVVVSFSMIACTTTQTPTSAWSGVEVLKYSITSTDGSELGTMTTTMCRETASIFTDVLDDVTYSTTDCNMISVVDTTTYSITTTVLAKSYTALAIKKIFVDKENDANSYTMIGYHSGKYFYYTLNGEEQTKLKVGSSGYTDSEFIYNYIRCYEISDIPTSLNVADTTNGTVTALSLSYSESAKMFESVPYPDSTLSINCNMVTISLSDTPSGKSINVYYTPDLDTYNLESFAQSATTKKIPVMIEENDVVYTLVSTFTA
jgi:hypothetical protein